MVTYEKALRILRELAAIRALPADWKPLEECVGRICAAQTSSPGAVPPFDNAAMDGFAVNAARTAGATPTKPVRLCVTRRLAAGDDACRIDDPGLAAEIMTGAAMPSGVLDAVVRLEDVARLERTADDVTAIVLHRPVEPGENARAAGSDFAPQQTVVRAGARIMPEHVMALASVGVTRLAIRRAPTVAVISTGRELVHHSSALSQRGTIRNSTTPYLMAALPLYGAEPRYYGNIPDDEQAFTDLMVRLLRNPPDIIITSGAVSMGRHDFVGSALRKLDARICFHKVAIRPGKPLLVAEWPHLVSAPTHTPGPILFGLPGNPAASVVGLRFFVEPYLRAIAGRAPEPARTLALSETVEKPEGLRCFYKARIERGARWDRVRILPGQQSYRVRPLLGANAWAVLPEAGGAVEKGALLDVFPLHPDLFDSGMTRDDTGDDSRPGEMACCA